MLVVSGSLVLLAVAGASMAVPVTFSDGNVLNAQQLNDNFADLEQKLAALAGSNKSGTRLKGKYLLGSDGSKQYQFLQEPVFWQGVPTPTPTPVWWDSLRGEDCTFEKGSDGKMHCLPLGLVEEYYFFYNDYTCTQVIVQIPPPKAGCTATAPKYFRKKDGNPAYCGSEWDTSFRIHQLVGVATSIPSTLFEGTPSNCVVTSKTMPGSFTAYQYGTEIDPSNFVEGTSQVDP